MKWWITFALGGAACIVLLLLTLAGDGARAADPRPAAQPCQDEDGDGFGRGCARGSDCNDRDPAVNPGQRETCGDLVDNDCNGLVDDAPRCEAPPIDPSPVRVSAGSFVMGSARDEGSADERPRHRVTVSTFSMDRHEVTNQRYAACVAAGGCTRPALLSSHRRVEYYGDGRFADYPVIFVDWKQAAAFCAWAGGRLPTEAEWEKAARGPAPSIRRFPWGNEAADCRRANMGGARSCVGDTDRVGRRPEGASPYGAMDMAGNVWEWVSDWYAPSYYASSPERDPRGPATGRLKVMRGGCWISGADSLRVSCRKAELPASWAYNVGFRCVYAAAPGRR